ncbi:hypothetical protein L207DRAFT_519556 [Hyaloscypha variabilis F]|uniref:Heterokaryon incompatibility domain-containing protein n=1 Tax=Hyaloscypha variabilis (strain UAMH 11265 / GT02V1 / F) TaxID=1149755 RepID=A0A2J6QYI6_HYAVF|nr:hypothetical protein L207DRAFT_519556 [Hyaloscypha variabilis F]
MFSAAISRVKRMAKPLRHRKGKDKGEQEKETQIPSLEPESLDIAGLVIEDNPNINVSESLIVNDNLEANNSLDANHSLDIMNNPDVTEYFGDFLWRISIMELINDLNETSKDRFNYGLPLKERTIRLIRLHSGSGDDPIVCSMTVDSLNGGLIPFEAVSYVWGSEENPRSITCNWAIPFEEEDIIRFLYPTEVTNNMKVTENLYHLMLRLRLPGQMRTLWIDQICIDQDENPEKLDEKMAQVRMMAEVYSAAENVLIWLGEEDSETGTAFGMLEWAAATEGLPDGEVGSLVMYLQGSDDIVLDQAELGRAEGSIQKKATMDYLRSLLVHVQPTIISGLVDPEHPYRVHMTFIGSRALSALLERPWFSRSWTFQEAISARRATIMCGSHKLPWEILYRACKSMQTRRIVIKEPHSRVNLAFAIESTVRKGDLQRDWARLKAIGKGQSNRPDDGEWLDSMVFYRERRLKRLLPLLRSTTCKDPRDKVLALLGIGHDDSRWIVFPNYKWPVVNLYTCIVSYWIRDRKRMDISFLNHVQNSHPEYGLPSWVPDWNKPAIARPLVDLADFSAAGDTVPEVFMEEVDFLNDLKPFPYYPPIAIEGFFILKVQDVEADLTKYEHHAEMLNRFEDPYPTTELPYLDAYRRTVYPNIPEDLAPVERAKTAPSFWEYVNNHNCESQPPSLDSLGAEHPTVAKQHHTASELQCQVPDTQVPLDDNSRIQSHTRAPAPGRAFFIATTGFIGLCPKDTQPGDVIYIFLGGATPFVVRVLDDGDIKFVGECFVLGLMHGEAVEGRPKQRVVVIMR